MTKTQQIAAGLKALGWTVDTNTRTTKGTAWKGGLIPGLHAVFKAEDEVRIYQSNAGTARLSRSGRKGESSPLFGSQITAIIAAGATN
jgi:hypothetical protein